MAKPTFAQQVKAKGPCFLIWAGGCDGPTEAHHLIRRQRIMHLPVKTHPTKLKREMIRDPRNGIPLCRNHHHRVTHGFTNLTPAEIPTEAIYFALEHGIEWALEKEVPDLDIPARSTRLGRVSRDSRTSRVKTGKGSRSKGNRGEKEVEDKAREHGFDPDRAIGGRVQTHADITGLPETAMEVRYRERIEIVKWSEEHEAKTPPELIPAIAYRKNNQPWRVSLPLDRYFDLLHRAQ